jgi:hypothetical protein
MAVIPHLTQYSGNKRSDCQKTVTGARSSVNKSNLIATVPVDIGKKSLFNNIMLDATTGFTDISLRVNADRLSNSFQIFCTKSGFFVLILKHSEPWNAVG